MWQPKEISQGESGASVSGKLDGEFQRIQTVEEATAAKFDDLLYTDQTTVMDRTMNKLIVSPWTLWSVLDSVIGDINKIERVTDHFTETLFDGSTWIRSDVYLEYSGGGFKPFANLGDGFYLTKAHGAEILTMMDAKYLSADGSESMPNTYEPKNDQDIATKVYVDNKIQKLEEEVQTSYIEFPPANLGDTKILVQLGNRNFVVYLNGILWRRAKYAYDHTSITFHAPLSADDEVTILILGE